MALLEVKKTPNGKVLARRRDGKPLTARDRKEAKQMIQARADLAPIRGWGVQEIRGPNGYLRAIQIRSAVLEAYLWVIWDRTFQPKDNLAVYFREEMPLLKGKSMEDLKLIQETKLIFPGCRVIQEEAESQE